MERFRFTPHDPGTQIFAAKRSAGFIMGTLAHARYRLFGHGHTSWSVSASVFHGIHRGNDGLASHHRGAILQHGKPAGRAIGPRQFYGGSGGIEPAQRHGPRGGVLVYRLRCRAMDRCKCRSVAIPTSRFVRAAYRIMYLRARQTLGCRPAALEFWHDTGCFDPPYCPRGFHTVPTVLAVEHRHGRTRIRASIAFVTRLRGALPGDRSMAPGAPKGSSVRRVSAAEFRSS